MEKLNGFYVEKVSSFTPFIGVFVGYLLIPLTALLGTQCKYSFKEDWAEMIWGWFGREWHVRFCWHANQRSVMHADSVTC